MPKKITLPDNFITNDPDSITEKLANFTLSNTHIIFDFDRTMTTRNPGALDDVTTWSIVAQHLPEAGRKYHEALYEKYRVLEINHTMTEADAVEWWSSILNLFVEHRINLLDVEADFLNKANIRPGVAEIFQFCYDNYIPTIILSAGILDVITIWCKHYSINPSLILSTALKIDINGVIRGWQKDTLVHVLNKSEASHPELDEIRAKRPNIIILGDSLSDAAMATGDKNVLRVRVLDQRDDEDTINPNEKTKTLMTFDGFINTGDLVPLLQVLSTMSE